MISQLLPLLKTIYSNSDKHNNHHHTSNPSLLFIYFILFFKVWITTLVLVACMITRGSILIHIGGKAILLVKRSRWILTFLYFWVLEVLPYLVGTEFLILCYVILYCTVLFLSYTLCYIIRYVILYSTVLSYLILYYL